MPRNIRDAKVVFRVTKDELMRLRKMAVEAGCPTPGDFIRRKLLPLS